MRLQSSILLSIGLLLSISAFTQTDDDAKPLTKADTLRGSNNANRDWWDVLKYDITVEPDFKTKTIEGYCTITFKAINQGRFMQIDLQDTLTISSITLTATQISHHQYPRKVSFEKVDGVYLVKMPMIVPHVVYELSIIYKGKPREAVNPPWQGGWVWKKDKQNNPWISVACQGLGASSWFPCKDMQSDEPDSGASLTIVAPKNLVSIANGRLKTEPLKEINNKRYTTWTVKNPINNYNIIPYIGNYTNFTDTLMGEDGKLDLSYWVLPYNLEKAKKQFAQLKPMLHCFEYWFGKYPFYEDSYKLVEAPYLGMEHQSAVAYGNNYGNGYKGNDLSGSGWGLKWDFIIIHESGHEWFGNNITANDLADLWIHESFTMYSEVLYTEWLFGKEAGIDYCVGLRGRILNDKPMIAPYGVNKEGSGDIYYKGANLINSIRNILNNDSSFRALLRGMNKTFYHQTVTTQQIENYLSAASGIDLSKVFDQYLRTTQIPQLQYSIDTNKGLLTAHWTNCIDSFRMPITIPISSKRIELTTHEQVIPLTQKEIDWFTKANLERAYYIKTRLLNE